MKRAIVIPAVVVVFVAALSTIQVSLGADWPQWRGPNRNAKVTGFAAPSTWPKELTQKWQVTVGIGDATPSLVGGKLYVFTMQDGNEVIRCFNAATGDQLWQDKYPQAQGATGPASRHNGPRASPTVAEGKVVTLGVRGKLSCLDAETGKLLWRKDEFESWPRFFTSSSPIVVDGVCIAQLGGREGQGNSGGIIAYDLTTGDEKWKWPGDSPAYASPVLMSVGGEKLVVALTAGKLVALAAADGKLAWETAVGGQEGGRGGRGRGPGGPGGDRAPQGERGPASEKGAEAGRRQGADQAPGGEQGPLAQKAPPGERGPQGERGPGGRGRRGGGGGMGGGAGGRYNASTPVVDGPTLYYVVPGGMKAVRLEREGDKIVAKELWTNPETSVEFSSPVLKDGLMFGLTAAGRFFCVNVETGKTAWIGPGGLGSEGYGSIVDAGSVLLALTPGSELLVIKPIDKEYTEIARIKVADTPTYAHLVVAGNRLFVKDQNSLMLWMID